MTAERDRAVSSASGALVISRPLSRITTWSTVWATSASRWLDTTTVRPASAWLRRKRPQPVHAFGVEAVGGLVEDEHRRLAEQGGGEAEALAHAEREAADAAVRVLGHGHLGQRLVDPLRRQPGRRGEDAEVIDRPAAGVEAGRFQHGTDVAGGLVEVDVAPPVERGASRRSGRRGRAACAAWWSCRHRSVRGSR